MSIVKVIRSDRPAGFAVDSAFALALLLAAMSIAGLSSSALYARETPAWTLQAVAQDWFDLCVAVPVLGVTAILARGGSLRARLLLAGAQLFASYTLAIYCFAVHLNALFLVYCAAFGLSIYGLGLNGAQLASVMRVATWDLRGRRTIGGVLIGIAVVFAMLWLGQIAPALARGTPPKELSDTGLFTNPVHVLDLSLILPLHVIAGIAVWKRRWLGRLLAPVLLGFGALMAASIAVLVLYAESKSPSGGLPVGIAMSALATVSAVLAAWAMSDTARDHRRIA